jgi:hypothetical protein
MTALVIHRNKSALLLLAICVLLGLALSALPGCAGVDQGFRSSVESVSVGAEATANGDASGNFTVHLRDPRGFAK